MAVVAEAEGRSRHPPRVAVALRVGVVGNRLLSPELDPRYHEAVGRVLAAIRDCCADLPSGVAHLYTSAPATMRVVTSIAEGADRVGALEGRRLGFELDCILPFERTVFAQDFDAPASRAQYEDLLVAARAVFELDGSREDERAQDLAYAAASERVLAQSDVLLVLWNGAEAKGPGGTATTVRAAVESRTPTVWIDAGDPSRVLLADDEGAWTEFSLESLRERVIRVLSPRPGGEGLAATDGVGRETFFREQRPGFAPLNSIWSLFRSAVSSGGSLRPHLFAHRYEEEARAEWDRGWDGRPSLPPAVVAPIDQEIRAQFTWADGLANYYANQYRSTFVLIYLLGIVAVVLAVLGQAVGIDDAGGGGEAFKAIVSLGTILAILALRTLGARRRWHDRWIDYRLLAEFFRHMRFLAPLCLAPPRTRQPVHRAGQDPGNSWMGWHARAVARQLGVVPAKLDSDYLRGVRALLRDGWVGYQVGYHSRNARNHKIMEGRLQHVATFTLAGTIAGIVLLLATGASSWSLLSAVLPAVGAALGGIRSQGELERVGRRSEAIALGLLELRDALDRIVIDDANGASARLARVAELLTVAMTDDVLDWRVVFDPRQLEPPP